MPQLVKTRRAYDSPRRREGARATRRAILDAARDLFIKRGFVATTVDGIATQAGVSAESVYSTFGSKRSILSELVDVSIAGNDEPVPILERAWVKELREAPDARSRLRILASQGRSILERRAALDEVVRGAAAADPEIAALWEKGRAQRFAGQRQLLRMVLGEAGEAGLRPGLDLDTAADVLYAIGSPETYQLLVVDRGWSGSQFERWYAETLSNLLLDQS